MPVVAGRRASAVGLVIISTSICSAVSRSSRGVLLGQLGPRPALLLAFIGYAAAHFVRGLFSGTGRFGGYGTLMGTDGAAPVRGCAALASAASPRRSLRPARRHPADHRHRVAAGRPPGSALHDGPQASWRELTPNLGWLLAGSVLAAALVNAGPIAANLLATDSQEALVSNFTKGMFVARVPLFLFQAVQAALLPKLARLAAAGELTEFRGASASCSLVVGVTALGTAGAFLIGPFA